MAYTLRPDVRDRGRQTVVSFAHQAEDLWRRPATRIAVGALCFLAVTVVTALIAHPRMFTGFASYDDEGYMLTALKGFVNHGHLYNRVFTQYGPFYYEAFGGLFSIFGIAVTHDSGRTVTMVIWILASLMVGLATLRMTASLVLGLLTQMLVFAALGVLTNEPMHPGGIICLLLATILCLSCLLRNRPSPFAAAALGAAVAALVLVKINVGGFAAISLAYACVLSYPALARRRLLRPAVEVLFVVLPFLLLAGKFGEGWARHYALAVAIAAVGVVAVLRSRDVEARDDGELGWLLGGFLVLAVVVCATILGAGTSLSGLIDGVLRQPLRQSDAFTIPLQLSRRLYALDLVALGGVFAYWYAARVRQGPPSRVWTALTSLFSIGVGVTMALSVGGKVLPFDVGTLPGYQFTMLPFVWVALIPASDAATRPGVSFARLLLPLLAVLQVLHAFPVAGSQTLWASFLLIPTGALCVANGTRGIATVVEGVDRRSLAAFGAVAATVLAYFVVNANLREPLDAARSGYDGQVSLGLPGAGDIHLNEAEAELYGDVSAAIRRNCSATLMLPGMDSFYLWTEEEPPSGLTATGWPTLFDDSHQQQVIEETRSIPGLCLLRNLPLAEGWSNGPVPDGPLVRYLSHGFEPIVKIQDYELLKRPGTAGPSRS